MSNPAQPPSRKPDGEEPLPVLEEAARSSHSVAEEVIPLVEETVPVDKRDVVTGRVCLQTVTDTIEELVAAPSEGHDLMRTTANWHICEVCGMSADEGDNRHS
ncbi:hypothetical protein [Microvirga sp. M2]|uniref:hypothetical protein n=1 Tax=Microvirga sp. M2 TaxID=3073270 RepID=UPI0039C13748